MKGKIYCVAMLFVFGVMFFGCDTGNNQGNDSQYTVTFDTDGGTTAPNSIKVDDGKNIGTLPPQPHKTANFFEGWFTEKNGNGNEFTNLTPVTNDITVYAKWTPANLKTRLLGRWTQTSPATIYAIELKNNDTIDTIMNNEILGNMAVVFSEDSFTIDVSQTANCVFSNNDLTLTISGLTGGATPFNGTYSRD
jgi:uncharacterized repeat protein (TIGR02543 family)